jgi:hypothetical protein
MDINKATQVYEAWLGARIPLIDADLRLKHQRMAQSAFPFFRATFYRWVQLWPQVCAEAAVAPSVLAVGDLHVENFGTWRDGEGRLIWGVNDFDEVAVMPYTIDLVRLAVSARLAISENHLACDPNDAGEAILAGYREAIEAGGKPYILEEQHRWLRDVALGELRDPTAFWQKFSDLPTLRETIPAEVKGSLDKALPPNVDLPYRVVHRQAGLGSLGRRRYVALAELRGGSIAREAKELAVSAWHWEKQDQAADEILYQKALDQAVRVPDPFVSVNRPWLIRRLAPHCSRIELAALPKSSDELKLLRAMGWETANIHLGTPSAKQNLLKDLNQRPAKWLRRAAEVMAGATIDDWKSWAK